MSKQGIKKNYIYNVSYQILAIVIPLITTPYLSKVLGAENIGIYSYTFSIVTYFILFGSLGVAMYGQREIAYQQDDVSKRSKTFFEILLMKSITLFIALIIFYFAFCINGIYSLYYKIFIVELVANIIDISWFFHGLEEFKKTVIRNTIVKIIGVISIFVFVKSGSDLYKYFLIYVASTFFGNLLLWFYLPKYLQKVKFKDLDIMKHLKPTISLFIPQIAIQIYTLLDKTMLGIFSNNMAAVGYYEQSQKIIKTALVLITALGTVVSPRIANSIANKKTDDINNYLKDSYHFVWMFGFPLMMGLIGISKTLVPWFLGEEFMPAISLICIGSLLIMAIGLNNVSGIQYLISVKKQNLFTKSVVIAAAFNFIFNLIFIPIYGAMGAIITSVMAEFLIVIVQAFDIRKDINIKIIYQDSIKYVIGSIIMFVPVFTLGFFMEANKFTTFLQIAIGFIIYFLFLCIIKEKLLYDILGKLKEKIVHD